MPDDKITIEKLLADFDDVSVGVGYGIVTSSNLTLLAARVFKTRDKYEKWLTTQYATLGTMTPLELLANSPKGECVAVYNYLLQRTAEYQQVGIVIPSTPKPTHTPFATTLGHTSWRPIETPGELAKLLGGLMLWNNQRAQ